MSKRTITLGIDPGSRNTGFGIIWSEGAQQGVVSYGCIQAKQTTMPERLHHIYQHLIEVITEHQPQLAAIEQVFTCRNPQSALKLGQARGVALAAVAAYALPLEEYSARQVKKSITGYGAADKSQIQHMVRAMLKLTVTPQADAADALAIALTHAYHQRYADAISQKDTL